MTRAHRKWCASAAWGCATCDGKAKRPPLGGRFFVRSYLLRIAHIAQPTAQGARRDIERTRQTA